MIVPLLALLAYSAPASANTGLDSQFSHFSGGFLGTLLVAYLIQRLAKRHPEKSALYAAIASTVFAVVDQLQQYFRHGKPWGQLYDFAAHTLGTIAAFYLLLWLQRRWQRQKQEDDRPE